MMDWESLFVIVICSLGMLYVMYKFGVFPEFVEDLIDFDWFDSDGE